MTFLLTVFSFLRTSWIGRALAIAGGVLLAIVLIFGAGKRRQRDQQERENLEEYIDARRRADKAADQTARDFDGISDDDLLRSLRKHNAIRD